MKNGRIHEVAWSTILLMRDPTPDDLVEATALVGRNQEDLAQYLETVFPGVTERMCRRYVERHVGPMLRGILPTDDFSVAALCDPKSAFDTTDVQTARERCTKHFIDLVNGDSPEHLKRAMISRIELGLGDHAHASRSAAFAVCLLQDPRFDEWMDVPDHPETTRMLLATEREKAEILIDLMTEERQRRAN